MRHIEARIAQLERTVQELLRRLQRYEAAPAAPAVPPGIINFKLTTGFDNDSGGQGWFADAVILDRSLTWEDGPEIRVWDAHRMFDGDVGYQGYAVWRPWGRWEIIQLVCDPPEEEEGGE